MAFLDRDGTLVEERGYLRSIDDLVLLPRAGAAVRWLNERGVAAVLTTNQSGAARGFYASSHIDALHARLVALLAQEGAHLDDVRVCRHLPPEEGGVVSPFNVSCRCRKPGPGLVEDAVAALDLDLSRAFVVGDKPADVGLGVGLGLPVALVLTGYGKTTARVGASVVVDDVLDAVMWGAA